MKKKFFGFIGILLSLLMVISVVPVTPVFAEDSEKSATSENSEKNATSEGDSSEVTPTEGIYVVGNGGIGSEKQCGNDIWMNGSKWDPAEEKNLMTEVYSDESKHAYCISFTDLPKGDNYQLKFDKNGTWDINWGGDDYTYDYDIPIDYAGSNNWQRLVGLGPNLLIKNPFDDATISIKFYYNTDFSAKALITILTKGGAVLNPVEVSEDYKGIITSDDMIKRYTGDDAIVNIPKLIGSYNEEYYAKEIDCGAFANCKNVTDVIFPKKVYAINAHAFTNCTSLTNVTLDDNLTYIGAKAFSNCTSLKKIRIPVSVTKIEPSAFDGCENITIVGVPASAAHTFAIENGLDFEVDTTASSKISVTAEGYNGYNIALEGGGVKITRSVKNSSALFTGLYEGDYTLTLKNREGRALAKKEVLLRGNQASCEFKDLVFRKYSVTVVDENDEPFTDYTAKWYVNSSNSPESESNEIDRLCEGDKVKCAVYLSQEAKLKYELPKAVEETVTDDGEIFIRLKKHATVETKINVKDSLGEPIADARLSFIQTIDSKTNENTNYTTDKNGSATVTLKALKTELKVSKNGYFNYSDTFTPDGNDKNITLESESGVTFITSFKAKYTDGTEGELDPQSKIVFKLTDSTKNREIKDFTYSNGVITISDSEIEKIGTHLIDFTAIHKSGMFANANCYGYNENKWRKLNFLFIEHGRIKFSYQSRNGDNMALIFDSDGDFAARVNLNEKDESPRLESGNYKVVMMAQSATFASVSKYSELLAGGLTNGENFIAKDVEVKDGEICQIKDVLIPEFSDEDVLLVDRTASYISFTPTNAAPGNLVTVTAVYSLNKKALTPPTLRTLPLPSPRESSSLTVFLRAALPQTTTRLTALP